MKTKCLIFDMDGVIIDSEKLAFTVIAEILQEHGHHLTLDHYLKVIGISQELSEQYLTDTFSGVDGKGIYEVFFQRYFKALKTGRLEAKPGLVPLLAELDKRGIKRGVASSNKRLVIEASLKCIGVFNRMDAVVHPEMVERVKPYPDLFLKAASLLGAAPEECLVLEDSPAGVKAAVAAGIPVIFVTDLVPPAPAVREDCLHVFDSLYDVIDFLRVNDICGEGLLDK